MSHKADAVVLSCIDYRFRKSLVKFLEHDLNLKDYDHKSDGGGVQQIVEEGMVQDWILKNFEIAFDLHNVDRVILVNHEDCGAYGGSKAHPSREKEISFHEGELKKAVGILGKKYPHKQIEGYLAMLGNEISFKKIV